MVIGPRPIPTMRVKKIIDDYKQMARLPRPYCPDLTAKQIVSAEVDEWGDIFCTIPEPAAPVEQPESDNDAPTSLLGNVIDIYV